MEERIVRYRKNAEKSNSEKKQGKKQFETAKKGERKREKEREKETQCDIQGEREREREREGRDVRGPRIEREKSLEKMFQRNEMKNVGNKQTMKEEEREKKFEYFKKTPIALN